MPQFQELYLTYNRDVFRFIKKLTNGNEGLAEELTQETFFQVFLSLGSYRGECGVFTWICSIARHVCAKYYRANPICLDLSALPDRERADKGALPQELLEKKELSARIIQEILSLGKKYKDVLIYRLLFELSFRQISELMNIKENAAKVIYHRGREQIRRRMGGFYDGI